MYLILRKSRQALLTGKEIFQGQRYMVEINSKSMIEECMKPDPLGTVNINT